MTTLTRRHSRMKRLLVFILCTCLAAVGSFMVTRWAGAPKQLPADEQLAWLQAEFQLTPAQAAAVKILHDDYQPVCRDHCQKIQQAKAGRDSAKRVAGASAGSVVEAANAEVERVEAVCRDATQVHLQRVAALMEPVQGARFLALVLPKLAKQSHEGPIGLK